MTEKQKLLKDIHSELEKNTKLSVEIFLNSLCGASDEKILEGLSQLSKNLSMLQTEINFQLKTVKHSKQS